MSDETKPQDSAAMSPASAGSQCEPVAWVAFAADASESVALFLTRDAAERAARKYGWFVAELFARPALTDEERQAMDAGADALESLASNDNDGRIRAALMIAANTLRGFLNRTK